jgi:5-methyltetrahydrofolate--homocysteine methyltransferase
MVDGRAQYNAAPEEFAGYVPQLVELGAAFVGGCCGTRPDFVTAIRRQLNR